MQIETMNFQQDELINAYPMRTEERKSPTLGIDPATLAYLNFGLFKELLKRGTSRERICSALSLSAADFDYIARLE